jgi:hypothetical protein
VSSTLGAIAAVVRSRVGLMMVLAVLGSKAAAARAEVGSSEPSLSVHRLEVRGLHRTRLEIVERELLFGEGETVPRADVAESVQRLRNMGLFARAEYVHDGDGALTLELVERWTTLPVVRFARGGGLFHAVVGLYDINILGRYLEVGGQWEYLGGTHSFVVWHRNPRLFGERVRFAVDAWSIHRIRLLYDEGGAVDGGFLLSRRMLSVALEREWRWWLLAGGGVEITHDSLSLDHLPEHARTAQAARGLPGPLFAPIVRVGTEIGRLDHDNYRVDGQRLDLSLRHADPIWGAGARFTTFELTGLLFRTLPWRSTAGARLSLAATNAEAPQHRLYTGGFDGVRGFPDSRFSGTVRAMANLELRIPSVDADWLVLQHVLFLDGAAVGDGVRDASGRAILATGIGVRVIVPRLYRILMRADLARPLARDAGWDFTFGVQQYF